MKTERKELDKTYEPEMIERQWYEYWIKKGCFKADPQKVNVKRQGYSIVIPPPNVTGILTLGHVLNNTIQDILARRARMAGKEVLWLPGTDHAGIATQNVVEKNLRKAGAMKHRDEMGREALVEKIWEWKDKHGGIIIEQLKRLGASCDWERERFTMDESYSKAVQEVFVDLHRKGYIYKGKRMVNWCPSSLTALSDEEVVMKPQQATLYYFKVEVVEEPGTWLTIATTRPETIPGDTAVAVNPKDERYSRLIGKKVRRPLPVGIGHEIPIVGDDHVDFGFGTGVLKVTPAHDKADFEIGLRHQLAVEEVILANGVMAESAGADLAGLERFAARKKAVELLQEMGVMVKEESYQNNVGYSERADVPIEPRLSEQWFLRYPKVKESREAVASGRLKFYPERWAKVYDHWLENIQDWCISRQLWWGHRVPVWYHAEPCGYDFKKTLEENQQLNHKVEMLCQLESPGDGWVQDPDVLDTWFSSWLWPFATMGWPQKTDSLKAFYPTTDLVTGPDIIFFWVARMIMAGYEYMDEQPFKNVYFTGIIRDKQGKKMSKSLGNSPDPLDLMAKYSADALRFGIMRSAPLGQDILFDEKNVELGRNFCTKLWNAARFRQMQGGMMENEIDPVQLSADDQWILSRMNLAVVEMNQSLGEYHFSDAAQTMYRFFWSEYCDWYVESVKSVLQGNQEKLKNNTLAVMDLVLATMLKLFHPYIPFITEELWHAMGYAQDMPVAQGGTSLMYAPLPKPMGDDEKNYFGLSDEVVKSVEAKHEAIILARSLKSSFNIPQNKKVIWILKTDLVLNESEKQVLKNLLNAEKLEVVSQYTPEGVMPVIVTVIGELFMSLEGVIDVALELKRLSGEQQKCEEELTKVRLKLADQHFIQKVPAKVLEEHQMREQEWENKLKKAEEMLRQLNKLSAK
jgi:valyl-tRNA synthetase